MSGLAPFAVRKSLTPGNRERATGGSGGKAPPRAEPPAANGVRR